MAIDIESGIARRPIYTLPPEDRGYRVVDLEAGALTEIETFLGSGWENHSSLWPLYFTHHDPMFFGILLTQEREVTIGPDQSIGKGVQLDKVSKITLSETPTDKNHIAKRITFSTWNGSSLSLNLDTFEAERVENNMFRKETRREKFSFAKYATPSVSSLAS